MVVGFGDSDSDRTTIVPLKADAVFNGVTREEGRLCHSSKHNTVFG
jgi:hypothetical protein